MVSIRDIQEVRAMDREITLLPCAKESKPRGATDH